MRINEMNDQEKSVPLAKAMGWEKKDSGFCYDIWDDDEWINQDWPNLYDPVNMALAKRAIEWGAANIPEFKKTLNLIGSNMWILPGGVTELLDEILSMLIEAGLVEVNDV